MQKTVESQHLETGAMETEPKSQNELETVGFASDRKDHDITKWQAVKENKKAVAWIGLAIFVLCLQGFDNQAGGIVVGIEQFRKDFGFPFAGNYVIPAEWQSAFTGGPIALAIVGALFGGWLADVIGRKWTITLAILNTFVGVACEFVATTNAVFFVGKMIMGISIGVFNTVCVSYVSEISPLALRGLTTAMCNLSLAIGPLICVLIGNEYASLETRWAYRGIFVGQWVFAAIAIPFTPFMPESPWWLSRKGRQAEALHSLRRLGYTVLDAENHLAFIQLTDAKAREETSGTSYFECFRKANRRRTWITVMPLTVQALSGVAFVSGYSTYYFQLAGLTVKRSFELSCAAQGLSIAGNIASWFIIDRVGRRPLIVYGMWFLTAALLVTGGLATSSEPNLLLGTVGLIMFYNFAFNIVIGAVAYTIIAEIPTARLRTKTIAISITIQQAIYTIEIFVLPYIFNPDQANLGAKTAFIFGGFSVICCMVLWIFMPETANRSFQEIDEMFFHQVPPRKFKTYVTQTQSSAADLHSDVKTEDIDCV